MNKEDWIWVAIRIFGIYLIILSITNIPELIANWCRVSPFTPVKSTFYLSSGEECQLMADRMRTIAISNLVASIARVIFFSAMGIYLIKGGKLLFNIIMPNRDEGVNG